MLITEKRFNQLVTGISDRIYFVREANENCPDVNGLLLEKGDLLAFENINTGLTFRVGSFDVLFRIKSIKKVDMRDVPTLPTYTCRNEMLASWLEGIVEFYPHGDPDQYYIKDTQGREFYDISPEAVENWLRALDNSLFIAWEIELAPISQFVVDSYINTFIVPKPQTNKDSILSNLATIESVIRYHYKTQTNRAFDLALTKIEEIRKWVK